MFDSLADKMKEDQKKEGGHARMILWVAVPIASVLLFAGLYYGVRLLE